MYCFQDDNDSEKNVPTTSVPGPSSITPTSSGNKSKNTSEPTQESKDDDDADEEKDGDGDTPLAESTRKRKMFARRRWPPEQEKELRKEFRKQIMDKCLPNRMMCLEAMQRYPHASKWEDIKNKVRNIITTNSR